MGTMTTKQAQFFFEQHLRVTCTKSRYRRYCFVLDRFLSQFPTDKTVDSFLWSDIQEYREQRRCQGASARTIELECTVAKALWDWLLFHGHSNTNPFRGQANTTIRVAGSHERSQWERSREQPQGGRRMQA